MAWATHGLLVPGMPLSDLKAKHGNKYMNGHVAIVHGMQDGNHPGFPLAWWACSAATVLLPTIRQSFRVDACDDRAVRFAFAPVSYTEPTVRSTR
jgi:hypothetical protein